MKLQLTFRLAATVLTFLIGLIFLQCRRDMNSRIHNSTTQSRGEDNTKVSNNDYIFFEAVSKYLFISLQ